MYTQQKITGFKQLTNILVDRLTDISVNICAQIVKRTFVHKQLMNISVDCLLHPFEHKLLTYILVDRLLSVCAQTVDPCIGTKKEKKM